MKSSGNKIETIAIFTIILMMTSVMLMAMPVQAQSELQVVTHAYLSFTPNPIGLGQAILVNVWTTPPVNLYRNQTGYTVTITKPDGTKDIFTPIPYAGDSTAWFGYTVNQVGTWTLKFDYAGVHFPAATVPATTASNGTLLANYYQPCSTEEQKLVVQQEMVASWPPSPLPTDYWKRPISSENREWYVIGGNYPATGIVGGGPDWPSNTNTYMGNMNFIPYVQGPSTAHIVWRRQGAISGLPAGVSGYQSLSSGGGTPSIIYAGRCYQTITKNEPTLVNGTYINIPSSVWECYDLRTGQVYWDQTGVGTQAPTIISYKSSITSVTAGLGSEAVGPSISLLYIGGGRLIKYDPWTGAVTLNVSTSTAFTYTTFYADPYAWSTQTIGGQTYLINWTTAGTATVFSQRIISNITFALPVPPGSLYAPIRQADYEAGIGVYMGFEPNPQYGAWIGFNLSAASLKTGQLLWSDTISGDTDSLYSPTAMCCDHGKVAVLCMDRYWACYDLYTGKLLWRSEKADYPWGFGWAYAVESAYGLLYGQSYCGVYAFDWNTGKIVWHYIAPTPYQFETPYSDNGTGDYSFNGGALVADGKLYTYNTEHTPTEPITRGWMTHCINATTGKVIWRVTGSMSPGAIADGYLTASNSYDGYMYVFGKGMSAATISTPDVAVPLGTAFAIKGTVMDMSPGDQGSVQNPIAPLDSTTKPGTVPCVSADSMATQMQYLYMQHPLNGISHNETITGVPVTLTAIASDGTVTDIGTTTTNGYYGTFGMEWTPPAEGMYTVTASFAGDDSYGSSSAATTVCVGPGPSVAPTATPTSTTATSNLATTSDLMTYLVVGIIIIIIAIAIVGVLILRKH